MSSSKKSSSGSGKSSESSDKYAQAIRELQARCPENKACFECRQRGPTYVDVTIGSFVCSKCSGVLRGITPPHRVKSISMATFTHDEVESIRTRGNVYNAKVWLGLYDFKSRGASDIKDDDSIRELIVQKYEKRRFYVDPSTIRHIVEPEQDRLRSGNTSQTSPPGPKFIGSTIQFHGRGTPTPSASSAVPKPVAATSTPPPNASTVKLPVAAVVDKHPATAFPGPSVPLSKILSSVAPAEQTADPFGVSTHSNNSGGGGGIIRQDPNDIFGKSDSFANFDAANIYTSPTSNPLTVTSPPSNHIDFGFPPMPILTSKPVQPSATAKPAVAAQPPAPAEDKYAALKDLDNIFKSSVEVSSKSPTFGMSNGIGGQDMSKPVSANSFGSSVGGGSFAATSARSPYNPFASPTAPTSSGSPGHFNTSPWPLSASPSGPAFGSSPFAGSGFGGPPGGAFGQKDFFPSPWDNAGGSSTTGQSNNVDFFATKGFNDPWAESGDSKQQQQQPAFGFNKKNPFL